MNKKRIFDHTTEPPIRLVDAAVGNRGGQVFLPTCGRPTVGIVVCDPGEIRRRQQRREFEKLKARE